MKRPIPVLTLLVVLGATVGHGSNDAEPPMLRVESEQLHIGDVDAGSSVEGVFRFENLSDQPIRILRAKPT